MWEEKVSFLRAPRVPKIFLSKCAEKSSPTKPISTSVMDPSASLEALGVDWYFRSLTCYFFHIFTLIFSMLFSIFFFFNVLEKSLMLYDQLHYFQSLRASTLVELKFLVFSNSKIYFISFNASLYKSLNINGSIFLLFHLNILSFSLFVSLFITLSMWPTFFTFLVYAVLWSYLFELRKK